MAALFVEGCGKTGRDAGIARLAEGSGMGRILFESKYPEKPVTGTPDSRSHVDHALKLCLSAQELLDTDKAFE